MHTHTDETVGMNNIIKKTLEYCERLNSSDVGVLQ